MVAIFVVIKGGEAENSRSKKKIFKYYSTSLWKEAFGL